jgi:2-polyprenyl-3-methyl-5-hydroxy-6-metoxy-1,4-benzoquinol methylase
MLRDVSGDRYWDSALGQLSEREAPDADFTRTWSEDKDTMFDDVLELLRRIAPGKSVLDVGCGPGFFVRRARLRGFDAWGVEPGAPAAEFATEGLGLRSVERGTLATLLGRDRRFDAITLLNVLEHMPNPRREIALAARLLAPRGVIVVRVPNVAFHLPLARLRRALLAPQSGYLWPTDHVNQLSARTLAGLLGAELSSQGSLVRGCPTLEVENVRDLGRNAGALGALAKRVYYSGGGALLTASGCRLYALPCVTAWARREDTSDGGRL